MEACLKEFKSIFAFLGKKFTIENTNGQVVFKCNYTVYILLFITLFRLIPFRNTTTFLENCFKRTAKPSETVGIISALLSIFFKIYLCILKP